MRTTVHDHAPNTNYGQWPGEKPLFAGLESPAIAHNRLAASARFATFDVPLRDFPANRSPPHWKFVCRPNRKNLRAGGYHHAAHRFYPKQQRYSPRSKHL
jgi:hypothetical protein